MFLAASSNVFAFFFLFVLVVKTITSTDNPEKREKESLVGEEMPDGHIYLALNNMEEGGTSSPSKAKLFEVEHPYMVWKLPAGIANGGSCSGVSKTRTKERKAVFLKK